MPSHPPVGSEGLIASFTPASGLSEPSPSRLVPEGTPAGPAGCPHPCTFAFSTDPTESYPDFDVTPARRKGRRVSCSIKNNP